MFTTRTAMFSLFLALLSLLSLTHAQNAAAGGGAAGVQAASQYPTVLTGPSLLVVGGTTTTAYGPFTQTFKSPLTTWVYPTPSSGSVGLGNIPGTVGAVQTKK